MSGNMLAPVTRRSYATDRKRLQDAPGRGKARDQPGGLDAGCSMNIGGSTVAGIPDEATRKFWNASPMMICQP